MTKGPSMFDIPSLDPAKHAEAGLSDALQNAGGLTEEDEVVILDEKLKAREGARAAELAAAAATGAEEVARVVERVDAREARKRDPVLTHVSNRDGVRLLIFTRDETILNAESLARTRILELSGMFPEIHIVLLTVRRRDDRVTARIADNVWIYVTNSNSWWRMGFDAYNVAKEQLSFAGGFRADVIISEDPFEAGVAAYYIAEKFSRPLQVHVLEDIYDPAFKEADDENWIRQFMARFTLGRADCVRTRSEFLKERIIEEYKDLEGVTEALPIYHNLTTWRDISPSFDLHQRYPQFKFIILHVSGMQAHSYTDRVLNGAAFTLKRYPTVGLVIVGSGPMRAALEKQVITLGIQRQVVFESMQDDVISHMKTANILIHLSESAEEEDVLLKAATVKLPMIASASGLAGELFTDGESAFLCPQGDVGCISSRINTFLNENQARSRFALNAQEIIFERIEQDYGAYLEAYKTSIERCVAVRS
jgi:glycosyltransferase involved in cell wall biosynthesis